MDLGRWDYGLAAERNATCLGLHGLDALGLFVQPPNDVLDEAIAVLRGPRRRGRPPGSRKKVAAKKIRKRPRMSAEALEPRATSSLRCLIVATHGP